MIQLDLPEEIKKHLYLGKTLVFISKTDGNDQYGDGTMKNPYKTIQRFFNTNGEPDDATVIFVSHKTVKGAYVELSKSAFKKELKYYSRRHSKMIRNSYADINNSFIFEKSLFESKDLKHELDLTLPTPKKIKIRNINEHINERVLLHGWVQSIKRNATDLTSIKLRDGTGYIQCIITGVLSRICNAMILTVESSVCVYGVLKRHQRRKNVFKVNVIVDHWDIISLAAKGNVITKSNPDTQLVHRHLMLRTIEATKIIRVRCALLKLFREYYFSHGFTEITPPTFVATKPIDYTAPFSLNYFGKEIFLKQSSQFYLETTLPIFGNSFSISKFYNGERLRNKESLSEYTYIEAELSFVTFEQLIDMIEDMLIEVIDNLLEGAERKIALSLNPLIRHPDKPFIRMEYKDAVEYLRSHNILKEDGAKIMYGEHISDTQARCLADDIGRPLILYRFPEESSNFFHAKCYDDKNILQAIDMLFPKIGRVVSASMRIWKYDELMKAFNSRGIDPEPYYWYTDQRRYGSCPHGGYEINFERLCAWALDRSSAKDVCLYPRFPGGRVP